jgi:hypothetical protein
VATATQALEALKSHWQAAGSFSDESSSALRAAVCAAARMGPERAGEALQLLAGRDGGVRLRELLAAHAGSFVESALAAELGGLASRVGAVEKRQEVVEQRLELLERQAGAAAAKGPPALPAFLLRFWNSQEWKFRKAVSAGEFVRRVLAWFDADGWEGAGLWASCASLI